MEVDPDQWISNHPYGQEFWQLLAQQVSNLRLRLGFSKKPEALRCTLWAEALSHKEGVSPATPPISPKEEQGPESVASPVEEPYYSPAHPPLEKAQEPTHTPCPAPQPSSSSMDSPGNRADTQREPPGPSLRPAAAYGQGKFSGKEFTWQAKGKLSCPSGKELRLVEKRREDESYRLIYEAKAENCRVCSLAEGCVRTWAQGRQGRRVSFVEKVETSIYQEVGFEPAPSLRSPEVTPVGLGQMIWEDLPGRALRRGVCKPLSQQQVEIEKVPSSCRVVPLHRLLLRRDQRAHRRLSWSERLSRNALPRDGPQWRIQLYGVRRAFAEKGGIALRDEAAA